MHHCHAKVDAVRSMNKIGTMYEVCYSKHVQNDWIGKSSTVELIVHTRAANAELH